MTGPQVDPLRDFIRQSLTQEFGSVGTPEQLEEAVEHYARAPGNKYRQAYYQQAAQRGQQEAADAQLGMRSFGAVAERTARDVGTGLLKGVTSIPRAIGHALMSDPREQMEQRIQANQQASPDQLQPSGDAPTRFENWMEQQSGSGMGGRGLSSNPVMGIAQSMVQPAAEMAGAYPAGRFAMNRTGNALTNLSNANPQSAVLRALGTPSRAEGMLGPPQAGFGARAGEVARALPRAVVKGSVGGALGMPDETFAHGEVGTNLGLGAGLSALDALSAANIPRGSQMGGSRLSLRQLFSDPQSLVPETRATPQVAQAPVIDPATTKIQAEAQLPHVVEKGADVASAPGASAKPYTGGEPVDWANLDLTQAEQANKAFAGIAGNPQKIGEFLGIGETHLGLGGKKPHALTVKNVSEAKSPQDLHGWLQRKLISKASGSEAKYTNKITPRKASLTPKSEAAIKTDINAEEHGRRHAPAADEAALRNQQAGIVGGEVTGKAVPVEAAPAARPVKAKRQDVLRDAPRLEDGTLDWDKLRPEQRAALKRNLGKDYREQVQTMSLAQIQKKLSSGQLMSFLKTLKMQPSAKVEGVAEPTAVTPAPEAPVAQGTVTPRKAANAVQIEAAPASAEIAPAAAAPEASPQVRSNKISPGWWDSATTTRDQKMAAAKAVADQRQMPGDPSLWADQPFAQLPPFLRHGLPQQNAPALETAPTGGAAPKPGFRAKRQRAPKS